MGRRVGLLALCAVMALLIVAVVTLAEEKGEAKTKAVEKTKDFAVSGEVIDLKCYMDGDAHGAGHKQCAITCVKEGAPMALLDAKGNVYIAVMGKAHHGEKNPLADKIAETVAATGTLVKKGGVQVLLVASVGAPAK